MSIKKISIFGMGALGLMYAEHIQNKLGTDALCFVMDEARYQRHKNEKFWVNGKEVKFNMVDSKHAKPADLIIIATKYNGLSDVLKEMESSVKEDTIIISLLNGVISEKIIADKYGEKNVITCVALGMDALREGNKMTWHQKGILLIGITDPSQSDMLNQLASFFKSIEIPYEVRQDILHALWSKLMLNVGINQTCTVYETDYSGAMHMQEAKESMFAAMHEVIDVATAEGIKLTEEDFNYNVGILEKLTPSGYPSMRQDALAKRKTEVELFAGTIVKLGEKHGIAVPVNKRYYDAIKKMELKF